MAFSCFLFVVLVFIVPGIQSQGPPKVTGSYKATGEMVETLEDETKLLVQIAFEESYDADTQNAAFNVWVMGKNVTFIENYNTGQTFRYTEGNDCQQMTLEEWVKTKSPPQLLKYEDTNGTVRFSLKQLFALNDNYLKEKNLSAVFRGIPARKWMYEIKGEEPETKEKRILSIYAYWSDGSWNTTSNADSVPLGYIVSKAVYRKGKAGVQLHEQFVNVFGFVPGAINHKLFEPVQGVICKNKTKTIKFPDPTNIKALAFHSEVIFPDYQEIKYVDTWFDPQSKLLRMDMERVKDQVPAYEKKGHKYQSEIVIGKMGVVFQLQYYQGKVSCSVKPIENYEFDIQDLFNFKINPRDWKIGKLFGLNQTDYVYIGKTHKRDIPCHLFQGVRKDWPETSLNVESLWEWCFSLNVTTKNDSVIFRNKEYGLVSAQARILKSGSPGDYPEKFRIFHHFYDVNVVDPTVMDATNFDLGFCFPENQKRRLQFELNWGVTKDSIDLIENATSDVNFLKLWKSAIYRYTRLDDYSLRISDVKSMVTNDRLLVKFTILPAHKDLPEEIGKREISDFDAEENLRRSINTGSVYVSYIPSKGQKSIKVGTVKHSLKFQINTTFQPHVLPTTTPKPSTTPRRFTFSLITEPDDGTTTSYVTETGTDKTTSYVTVTGTGKTSSDGKTSPNPTGSTRPPTRESLRDPKPLHKGGTVAAVSIALLLVGISIGSMSVFVKYNGVPPCLKCTGTRTV